MSGSVVDGARVCTVGGVGAVWLDERRGRLAGRVGLCDGRRRRELDADP
jgi:hypothetical protein